MNAITYIMLTQRRSRGQAHFHWNRCSAERRREIEKAAKLYAAGGQPEYRPRADFTGVPSRTPNID